MVNFSDCINAAVIRHKGDSTFYLPKVVKGHDELCLLPAFPESPEEERYIKFYDDFCDWEAYDFTEAQHLHRMEQRAMAMCV